METKLKTSHEYNAPKELRFCAVSSVIFAVITIFLPWLFIIGQILGARALLLSFYLAGRRSLSVIVYRVLAITAIAINTWALTLFLVGLYS